MNISEVERKYDVFPRGKYLKIMTIWVLFSMFRNIFLIGPPKEQPSQVCFHQQTKRILPCTNFITQVISKLTLLSSHLECLVW